MAAGETKTYKRGKCGRGRGRRQVDPKSIIHVGKKTSGNLEVDISIKRKDDFRGGKEAGSWAVLADRRTLFQITDKQCDQDGEKCKKFVTHLANLYIVSQLAADDKKTFGIWKHTELKQWLKDNIDSTQQAAAEAVQNNVTNAVAKKAAAKHAALKKAAVKNVAAKKEAEEKRRAKALLAAAKKAAAKKTAAPSPSNGVEPEESASSELEYRDDDDPSEPEEEESEEEDVEVEPEEDDEESEQDKTESD